MVLDKLIIELNLYDQNGFYIIFRLLTPFQMLQVAIGVFVCYAFAFQMKKKKNEEKINGKTFSKIERTLKSEELLS